MILTRALNRIPMGLVVIVWLLGVGYGVSRLTRDSLIPGMHGAAPTSWQPITPLSEPRFQLLVFLHPQCSCSRATLESLGLIMSRSSRRPSLQFHFYKPGDEPAAWVETELWQSAKGMNPYAIAVDCDGVFATRFGAETSGFVVLYTPSGNRVFQGGITPSRGHGGTNPGLESVLRILNGTADTEPNWHTFGCPLQARECFVARGTTPCDR